MPEKISKPYPEFPLTPHASGKWQKKINGRIYYFGRLDDWESALAEYKSKVDYLRAGVTPPDNADGLTVHDACDEFYESRLQRFDSGEIGQRSLSDYKKHCEFLIKHFGKTRQIATLTAADFSKLKSKCTSNGLGPITVGNVIRRTRVLFRWLYENGLIDKPIRYGTEFTVPSKKQVRQQKRLQPKKEFTAEQLVNLVGAASPYLKAMILLSINGGFGQTDLSELELDHIDFESEEIDFPRPKTEVDRIVPLWPETIEALKVAIEKRRKPKKLYKQRVFVTKYGLCWVRDLPSGSRVDSISLEFSKLKKDLSITGKSLGFYSIRHTFRTIADETKDQPAIDMIMGHSDHSMGAAYRESIDHSRLRVVTNHVREWYLSGVEKIKK